MGQVFGHRLMCIHGPMDVGNIDGNMLLLSCGEYYASLGIS